MSKTTLWKSLLSGVAGASALTLLHETARHNVPQAPRVQRLGMRAIEQGLRLAGRKVPSQNALFRWALLGELVSNSLYYSAVAKGDKAGVWKRGALLGLSAGLGAVVLPGPMGLGKEPTNRTPARQAMTVAWYLVGGLAAAAAARVLDNDGE